MSIANVSPGYIIDNRTNKAEPQDREGTLKNKLHERRTKAV